MASPALTTQPAPSPTPLTEKNRKETLHVIRQMRELFNSEDDPDQRAVMARIFHTFALQALKQTNQEELALPKFKLAKPKEARAAKELEDPFVEDDSHDEDTTADPDSTNEDDLGKEELEGMTITTAKKKGGTKELEPVQFALSDQLTIPVIQIARDRFLAAITKLQTSVVKDNKASTVRFTKEEALTVTNFLFSDLLGKDLRARMNTIITYYTSRIDEGIPVAAGSIASELSRDQNYPISLRRFYSVFSAAHQQRLSSATQYATWQKHVRSLDLYNEFTRLHQDAVKKEPALVAFFEKSGLSTARGRDYRTLVNEHLCATLRVESANVLQNSTQAAKGIRALVDHFGDGILVMLPANAENRLNKFGNQKMTPVYKALAKALPNLKAICALVHDRVHNPMMRGEPLQIVVGQASKKMTLEEMLDVPGSSITDGMDVDDDGNTGGGENSEVEE